MTSRLYWLTNTGASSSRFYWENNNNNFSADAQKTKEIKIPVGNHAYFRRRSTSAPESWSQAGLSHADITIISVEKGGHFAAWEQPQLFAEELREAFRPVR